MDPGWLTAWVLLLVSRIPLGMLSGRLQGDVKIQAGRLLKKRLLFGALRLEPDEVRRQGVGRLLGRALESQMFADFIINGGIQSLLAVVDLCFAGLILALGAGGWPHTCLLLLWTAVLSFAARRSFLRRSRWTHARLGLTEDLVDRMIGHRTRLAQEPREKWHDGEDHALRRYVELSENMDRSSAVSALLRRTWYVAGLLGLAPGFVAGTSLSSGIAVGIGGILLGAQGLKRLMGGLTSLIEASIAWKQLAPFFLAAERAEPAGVPALAAGNSDASSNADLGAKSLLQARDLVFRYRGKRQALIDRLQLRVREGDHILLEGSLGAGKSTLASLLAGLRLPESGLLLAGGLDRQALGARGWARRVVYIPPFHENHVLSGTFAFNLLMGRRWPAPRSDIDEARTVCLELGLEPILKRMPLGLDQLLGEGGWPLSHGERSRLYIARALLQGADMVILDASFATLDPKNHLAAMNCIRRRAKTVMVISPGS